jgi:hypothetical protein
MKAWCHRIPTDDNHRIWAAGIFVLGVEIEITVVW